MYIWAGGGVYVWMLVPVFLARVGFEPVALWV